MIGRISAFPGKRCTWLGLGVRVRVRVRVRVGVRVRVRGLRVRVRVRGSAAPSRGPRQRVPHRTGAAVLVQSLVALVY